VIVTDYKISYHTERMENQLCVLPIVVTTYNHNHKDLYT